MGAVKKKQVQPGIARWRFVLVAALLCLLALVLVSHLARLQVVPAAERGYRFLQDQGRARTIRTEEIAAYRGSIVDRNGELLAVSTPVHSLWANPKLLRESNSEQISQLAKALEIKAGKLAARLEKYRNKEFMYLRRHLTPEQAERVLSLDLAGVYSKKNTAVFILLVKWSLSYWALPISMIAARRALSSPTTVGCLVSPEHSRWSRT